MAGFPSKNHFYTKMLRFHSFTAMGAKKKKNLEISWCKEKTGFTIILVVIVLVAISEFSKK